MMAREGHQTSRREIDINHRRKIADRCQPDLRFLHAEPATPLVDDHDIAQFVPKNSGYDGSQRGRTRQGKIGQGGHFVGYGPACCDRAVDDEAHLRPSSRADRISSTVMPVLRPARFISRICSTAVCARSRSSTSGRTMRATVFPWRVMLTLSPRSTSSRTAENRAFASVNCIVFMELTSHYDQSHIVRLRTIV